MPLSGETIFDSGKHINLPPQKRRVGYLFQRYALFPNMTVLQNIRCGSRAEKRRRAEEKLRRFRLEGLEKKYPAQLSGGQQQRTAPGERTTAAFNILADKCLCYK